MKVYLAPIIIVALIVAAIIIFVSCKTGFSGSLGATPPPQATPASLS